MKILTDLHCHTIASDHAYSTVLELTAAAKEHALELIALTDHAMGIGDAPHIWHFDNLHSLPRIIGGIQLLFGAEVNIMNLDGEIDLPENTLKKLDLAIASYHSPCCKPGSIEENTQAYLNVLKNPYVDILGHCGSAAFPFEHETVLKAVRDAGKIVEINNHTWDVRKPSVPNCVEIAKLCKKLGVLVSVDSDAHFCYEVGVYPHAERLFQEIGFPEELIVNRTANSVIAYMNSRPDTGRQKIEI